MVGLAPGGSKRLAHIATTPHGFTGHEHLNSLQLIHMNGRVYDYQLGRFLEVDPVIQSPTNSQSLNPYSYLMNNPLSGTDPTGYVGLDIGEEVGCMSPQWVCAQMSNSDAQRSGSSGVGLASVLSHLGINRDLVSFKLDNGKDHQLISPASGNGLNASGRSNSDTTSESGSRSELSLWHVHLNAETGVWERTEEVNEIDTPFAGINGMLNDPDRAAELVGAHLQRAYGKGVTDFTLAYNPTHGFVRDFLEAIADKIGITTKISRELSEVLVKSQMNGAQISWVAHSQGGVIFAEAVRTSGSSLSNMRVAFHGGANNRWATNEILRSHGVANMGYLNNPLDPVPNIAGLNTINPIKLIGSILELPNVFGFGPGTSPHTLPCGECDYVH
jgi:RHS repeat-associated protein